MKRACKRKNAPKIDRKATASLSSMLTATASSYKSCDLQELKMAGKRKFVESWLEILARVLARSPGPSPGSKSWLESWPESWPEKTEFMVISTRQKFLAENCSEINIQLDGHPISRVEHTKSLGLNIDDRLSWSNHIKDLCKKISSAIGALRRIRALISQSTAVQIYNALIQPHFDYCAPVWDGLSFYLCEKLQKLQNRAARVILQANCEINSSLLLETLKWDKLSSRRRKQKAIMMFKSLKGLAPVYLQDLFSERNTNYDLRDAFRKLNLPKPRTDYLKRSFGYSGALLWNSLPENIRVIRSIEQFKKEINRALKTSDSHAAIL